MDDSLSWHTDGYYNDSGAQVRSWVLMCRADAEDGGENALLDPAALYILLRDQEPEFIRALQLKEAMTIPPNRIGGMELRPARKGPVFSVDPLDGSLHMRYPARSRHVHWKSDPKGSRNNNFRFWGVEAPVWQGTERGACSLHVTLSVTQPGGMDQRSKMGSSCFASPNLSAALNFIDTLFSQGGTYIYRHRVEPGECLVSNNVLHNRSAFRDSPLHRRTIYRTRYLDRIRSDGV